MSIVKRTSPLHDEGEVKFLRVLLGFIFSFSIGFQALAAEKVVLREDLSVYRAAKETVSPLYKFRKGQTVQVSATLQSGFREVRGKLKDKVVKGFARGSDLEEFFPTEDASPNKLIGFSYVFAQQEQKDRELKTKEETTYKISKFAGSSQFFRLFYDFRLSPAVMVRSSLVRREMVSEGEAAVLGSSTSSSIELTQSFIGVQSEFLYSTGQYWVGGGLEVSKGTAVNIETKSGPVLEDSGLDLPFFTIITGSAGAYFGPYAGRLYVMPEIRAGLVVTTDPITQIVEVLFNVGYKL